MTMGEADVLYPQSTIGIVGNAFNDINLVNAAHLMGFKVAYYSDNQNNPAMKYADFTYNASFSNHETLTEFAQQSDVVTYNSDTIDPQIVHFISEYTAVPQGSSILDIIQDRVIERSFFDTLNINTVPYVTIVNLEDAYQAVSSIGYPALLKPIQPFLNNGKELLINKASDIVDAGSLLDTGTYILESYVEHDVDYSIIVTKGKNGSNFFPTIETVYHDGKVVTAFSAENLDPAFDTEMRRISQAIIENLDFIGTLEISFFISKSGSIYINKITPKLSNAGLVLEYSSNSTQFIEQIKAIANLEITELEDGFKTVQQMIRNRDYDRTMTQFIIKNNWHFAFNFGYGENDTDYVGYILIPTQSVKKTLEQIDSTTIWNDLSFKGKYSK